MIRLHDEAFPSCFALGHAVARAAENSTVTAKGGGQFHPCFQLISQRFGSIWETRRLKVDTKGDCSSHRFTTVSYTHLTLPTIYSV